MRIALATNTTHAIGGVETYVAHVVSELVSAGHEVSIACHTAAPMPALLLPRDVVTFSVEQLGRVGAVAALRRWRPDLVFSQGMGALRVEKDISRLAPVVYFAHGYQGMCVSGTKRLAFPSARPCERILGAGCLLCYYPRRCGGLSPITMLNDYVHQRGHLRVIQACSAVVTHSAHMYRELQRHGVKADRLHRLPFLTPGAAARRRAADRTFPATGTELRVVYVGRLDPTKGVHLLIEAAPAVARESRRAVCVRIIGDGGARPILEKQAKAVMRRHPDVSIGFTGRLDRDGIDDELVRGNVMACPSVWPEPFGLVGLEAGLLGLPVAAFSVGGIGDWLIDGVNGHIARGDPPRASGLSLAIAACVRDSATYLQLCRGASERASLFDSHAHIQALQALFTSVCENATAPVKRAIGA